MHARIPVMIAAFAACVLASPAPRAEVTAAPALEKRSTCTFSGSEGASSASASQKACETIVLSNVAVPAGTTLDLSELEDDTTVIFEGTTTWGYEEWDGPLLRIQGNHIAIEGADGAVLNPDGARWWDGLGSDGGKTKPYFFYAHSLVSSSSINNLYIENTPVQAVSVSGADDLTITDMTINNSAGNTEGGHNTDCFDISESSSVTITGANCQNQDDCVAVNSGTDITFSGGTCSGGHGLSIGSVGGRSDNTVNGVKFLNSKVENSMNGLRVKATEGDTGTITDVTYSNIVLSGISGFGIIIEQNYDGGDLKGQPTGGIPITDLTLSGIHGSGSVDSTGYNIALVCASAACSNWTWNDVSVTGGKTYSGCENYPENASCNA